MNHVFVLSAIVSAFQQARKKLFVVFVDYEKAFDSVDRLKLWYKLQTTKISSYLLRIITSIYDKTKSCLRMNSNLSKFFMCQVGVRQGDVLSPMLFNIFLKDFEPYLKNFCDGITFADSNNNDAAVSLKLFTLLYANDTILFSENEEDMQNAVNSTMRFCTKNNLEMTMSKNGKDDVIAGKSS